jgi:anti-sigma B factor antagonist
MLEWMVKEDCGRKVLALKGDFDLYGAPAFTKAMLGEIAGGWRAVTLDFSSLEYLDSTGVGSIIRLVQALRAAGGRLSCRGLHGSPRKVLEMSNIIALLPEEDGSGGRK